MLVDEALITVKAGDGGDGIASFRHEKYVPKGGPDGGDGGDGGEVYFICDDNCHTLSDYARKKEWLAESGENGRPKKQKGKDGQDLFLKVPPGTIIKVLEKSGDKANEVILSDLTRVGDVLKLASGGRGGWGNVHFATATHQSPTFARKGTPGEEKTLKLELKLLADVGLVG